MKQISVLIVFSLTLLLAPLAQAQFLPGAASSSGNNTTRNSNQPQMIDRIVAVVEDDIILQSDLDQAVHTVQQQNASNPQKLPPHKVLERQVLNQLILMKLQVQHAGEQGIRVSQDEVSNAIGNIAQKNHMSASQLRQAVSANGGNFAAFQQSIGDQILVQKLRNQVVQSKVQVTDAEVDNLLKNPQFSMGKVHLAHIQINLPEGATPEDISAAQERANKAEQAIKNGMDFNAAAIRYSQGQDALNGGDLGWRSMNGIPQGFADLVAKMKPGQVTPPLRSPNGFEIIKLIGRQEANRDVVTQYHARQILIKPTELVSSQQAQQKAEDLYRQITEKHKDFATLAKTDSDDDTSANIGGDLGWFQLQEHGPAVANVLQSLKKGEVSKPFQTRAGWDIIQLQGTREQDITEQMREQRARQAIGQRKAEQAYDDFLRQLRSSSYVNIRVPSLRDPDKQKQQAAS
jgi:peptidyl-prolyl cis-trans isomerase SurA